MNKRGFTLIELIAVIIIIAVLMLVAVPSVSSIIDNSRKSSYIDIANTYVDAVRAKMTSREFKIKEDGNTYYIPIDIINIETGTKQSPYGKWATNTAQVLYTALDSDDTGNCTDISGTQETRAEESDYLKIYNSNTAGFDSNKTNKLVSYGCLDEESISEAYVIVTYDTVHKKFVYYWASRDETGHTVIPTKIEELSTKDIVIYNKPISKFIKVDKYAVNGSNESNPTTGVKYTVDAFQAHTVGDTHKVTLYYPDKNFGFATVQNASFTSTTTYGTSCTISPSFSCNIVTAGQSFVTSCQADQYYMSGATTSGSVSNSSSCTSTSGFSCGPSTVGRTYTSGYVRVSTTQSTSSAATCSPSGSSACSASTGAHTWITCSVKYSYNMVSSNSTSGTCSTTASFSCNSSNYGRSYVSSCSPNYSYRFETTTSTTSSCSSSSSFSCSAGTSGRSYTSCTYNSSTHNYTRRVYSCRRYISNYNKTTKTCQRSQNGYTKTTHSCILTCQKTVYTCKRGYKKTTQICNGM